MRDEIDYIKDYITYLKEKYGFNITIHSKESVMLKLIYRLPDVNIHSEAYCTYVKSFPEMWDKCILNQDKIYKAIEQNNYCTFFGSCYAGVGEFISPILSDGACRGFICVGKYAGNRGKMLHMSRKYKIPSGEVSKEFDFDLSKNIPDIETVDTLIHPLCVMIISEASKKSAEIYSENENIVKNSLVFIHRNFSAPISLSSTAKYCHCTARTLSALFKKANGVTVGEYIENLRMKNAKKLLSDSELPVTNIAFLCGYADSNYFAARFRRTCGASPTEYRKTKLIKQRSRNI